MSEVQAAILWSQLEKFDLIQGKRKKIWSTYHENLANLEKSQHLRRPLCDYEKQDSFHNYFIILDEKFDRESVLSKLLEKGVHAVSHYEPLHLSVAGRMFSKENTLLPVTETISRLLIRLPFHHYLDTQDQEYVVETLSQVLKNQ